MDAQAGDALRTAFRRAEKRYKHYKHSSTSVRSSKLRELVPPTDLSEVLDFHRIKSLPMSDSFFKNGIRKVEDIFDWPVFTMEAHPGFYFIPEALNVEDQMYWIRESLTKFPQPPNRTNHTTVYGHISDLWNRAQHKEVLQGTSGRNGNGSTGMSGHKEDDDFAVSALRISTDMAQFDDTSNTSVGLLSENNAAQVSYSSHSSHAFIDTSCDRGQSREPTDEPCLDNNTSVQKNVVPMKVLLRKLRWATVGLQFDWSKRAYDLSLPYRGISPKLSEIASKLAKPAMNGADFHAEAAIVNYFGCDDMLGGHLDDMEADWSKPIVSMSFGCKAIFLLGGKSREENPTAMFLRSGDVVLMAGPARGCFHGVPRIFVDPEESDLPKFDGFDKSFAPFLDYIRTSRINLNIRQVS